MIPAFHPDNPEQLGNISPDGRADNVALQYVVDQVLRGIATEKAKQIGCFDNGKVITLDELLTHQRSEINWTEQKKQINQWLKDDFTLEQIAKKLGVTKSALSKANRKYHLYIPRNGSIVTKERAQIRRLMRLSGSLAERNPQSNSKVAGALTDHGGLAA